MATGTAAGLLHAERLALGDDDDGVMEQAVQQRGGGALLGQEAPPLVERPVAGDAQARALVGGRDEAEEQLGADVVERREAQLVDQDRRRGAAGRR